MFGQLNSAPGPSTIINCSWSNDRSIRCPLSTQGNLHCLPSTASPDIRVIYSSSIVSIEALNLEKFLNDALIVTLLDNPWSHCLRCSAVVKDVQEIPNNEEQIVKILILILIPLTKPITAEHNNNIQIVTLCHSRPIILPFPAQRLVTRSVGRWSVDHPQWQSTMQQSDVRKRVQV